MELTAHWSNVSMLFFIILGVYTIWSFKKIKQDEEKTRRLQSFRNPYFFSLWGVLTVFAVFRLVYVLPTGGAIGGTDAPPYINFFENCNKSWFMSDYWYLHQDLFFRYYTKAIRVVFSDYHFFFFFIYGLMIWGYVQFLSDYLPKKKVILIPTLLLIFLYWRGFNTIRSNMAIGVMMLSLCLIYRKRYWLSIAVALLACLTHKLAIIYVFFLPFFLYTRKKALSTKAGLVLILIVVSFSSTLSLLGVSMLSDVELNGSYISYMKRSSLSSFWDNFWKIAFEQIILGIMMLIYNKKITTYSSLNKEKKRFQLIWNLCLFDMFTIPVCFSIGAWRGYEFFYLPRLVMWCVILHLFSLQQAKSPRSILEVSYLLFFVAWMTFRFYSMWESSYLMPYIFEPIYLLHL